MEHFERRSLKLKKANVSYIIKYFYSYNNIYIYIVIIYSKFEVLTTRKQYL